MLVFIQSKPKVTQKSSSLMRIGPTVPRRRSLKIKRDIYRCDRSNSELYSTNKDGLADGYEFLWDPLKKIFGQNAVNF